MRVPICIHSYALLRRTHGKSCQERHKSPSYMYIMYSDEPVGSSLLRHLANVKWAWPDFMSVPEADRLPSGSSSSEMAEALIKRGYYLAPGPA